MNPSEFKAKLAAATSMAEVDVLMIQHWPEVTGTYEELHDLQFMVVARYESLSCRGCEGQSINAHLGQQEAA